MDAISEKQFRSLAHMSFDNVFSGNDPYFQPFTPHIAVRRILFEYWYEMESPLLEAVTVAASEQGDQGFYISILDRPPIEEQKQDYHWYIPFENIDAYHSLVGPLPNAVYSPSGTWGIICSDEYYGLLGGSKVFMNRIKEFMPELDDQVFAFLETWKYNKREFDSNISWIPGLIEHIYGYETANDLLRGFDI